MNNLYHPAFNVIAGYFSFNELLQFTITKPPNSPAWYLDDIAVVFPDPTSPPPQATGTRPHLSSSPSADSATSVDGITEDPTPSNTNIGHECNEDVLYQYVNLYLYLYFYLYPIIYIRDIQLI